MTRSDLIALLEEVTNAEAGSIKGDEAMLDLPGWDSLRSVEFMILLASKWNIKVSGVEVDKCERISDLAKLLKVTATAPATAHGSVRPEMPATPRHVQP